VVSSLIIIFGQLFDLYWLIMPNSVLGADKPVLGWQEVGPVLLLSGLVIYYPYHYIDVDVKSQFSSLKTPLTKREQRRSELMTLASILMRRTAFALKYQKTTKSKQR